MGAKGWMLAGGVVALGAAGFWYQRSRRGAPVEVTSADPASFTEAELRTFCSACHAFTDPDLLSKRAWRVVLEKMYRMYIPDPPPAGRMLDASAVQTWFVDRAPKRLPFPPSFADRGSGPLQFEREEINHPAGALVASIAHVERARLVADAEPHLVLCDMLNGTVGLWSPGQRTAPLMSLASLGAPAHAQIVDFDADGLEDLLVADLGGFQVGDHDRGQVVWLRQDTQGRFEERALLSGVGRVADARAADFDDDGDLDLVVAEFGWLATGKLLLLENRGAADFEIHVLDARTGPMHVPVLDFDGDGDLDIVTVHAQQHEIIVLHRNDGDLSFETVTLFQAPHPGWGSTSIEPVDLDRDGDLDVVAVNGDILDSYQVKPVHGVQLLENTGAGQMRHTLLATLPGAHRSKCIDLDGDGDLDILAAAFLPEEGIPRNVDKATVESLIWLEQVAPLEFERHSLEAGMADHAALDALDVDGDGDVDVVVGSYAVPGFEGRARTYPLTLFRNQQK